MTAKELLQRVRSRLRDEAGASADALWTDEDIIDDYANEARRKMFFRVRRMIVDSTTENDAAGIPLCRIPIVADTATYAVSPKILHIESIILSTQTMPLKRMPKAALDAVNPNWQAADAGEPWAYCPDMDTDKITLYPKPIANATASLTLFRHPLKPISLSGNGDLGFREDYHGDLIPGIQAEAFQKQDNEVSNLNLAIAYETRFLNRCEEIKRELLKRTGGPYTNRVSRAFKTK